jgi:hypothetical protein
MAPNQIAFYPQSSGGAGLPTASAAGQVPTSTGAGTTYTAQTPVMTLIQEQVLGANASSVTFSAIPSGTYKLFKLYINSTNTGNSATTYQINFNGDATAANYFFSTVNWGFSTTALPTVNGGFSAAGLFIAPDTSETTIYIKAAGGVNMHCAGQAGGTSATWIGSGIWSTASQMTSMVIIPNGAANFLAGSTFTLLGIQ